jgi:methanogenic corrinoid protein MtbC1
VLWQIGTISTAQEHFISNLIRQKIYAAIDGLSIDFNEDHKTFLIFLPEWELHDMGLLVYNYLIRKKGHKTVFLGQGVPLTDVAAIKSQVKPDFIVTSITALVEPDQIISFLEEMNEHFTSLPIYISGAQIDKLPSNLPANITKVASSIDFRDNILSNL